MFFGTSRNHFAQFGFRVDHGSMSQNTVAEFVGSSEPLSAAGAASANANSPYCVFEKIHTLQRGNIDKLQVSIAVTNQFVNVARSIRCEPA
jgi:hypothetical protein